MEASKLVGSAVRFPRLCIIRENLTTTNRSRLMVALVQQNTEDDDDCVESFCRLLGNTAACQTRRQQVSHRRFCGVEHGVVEPRKFHLLLIIMNRIITTDHHPRLCGSQVSVYQVPAAEAKGPVHARALQSRMVPRDAHFCMQIDSHMVHTVPSPLEGSVKEHFVCNERRSVQAVTKFSSPVPDFCR